MCDKPHHCTCTMSQASTWLTPQGDRVQRRSLHATPTHTHPFGQTRHGVRFCALHAWISRRTHTSHHVTSLSCQYKCSDCTHAIHYCTSCTNIDDRYYFRNEQTPNPFPPNDQFSFLKNIGNYERPLIPIFAMALPFKVSVKNTSICNVNVVGLLGRTHLCETALSSMCQTSSGI